MLIISFVFSYFILYPAYFLSSVIPSTGRPLHTIHEVDSEVGDNMESVNSDGDCDDRMVEGGGEGEEDEELGSPTRLMNHFM